MLDVGGRAVIRLAARLAVSGGRESVVRLVLTAVGVALGTTLLILSAATDPAIRAHQRHQAWQFTGRDEADFEGAGSPLLWRLMEDAVAGRRLVVLRVAAGGADAPVPLGLPHVPGAGEVYVSPPLARLIDQLPADRLAERFPSPPAGTIDRRYLAGPDELVAVVGVPASELRGQPATLEVHHIRTKPNPYQFSDFLRLVLGVAAVGLLLPVLVFVSTSTRLGAARREQRFAALRLAGATPRQTRVVAGVEAAASAVAGALLGALGFVLLRPRVARVEIDGQASFAGDVHVGPALMALIVIGVPALAVVAAMVSLHRLQISPLGVARRAVRARPTVRRLVPFVLGSAGFAVSMELARGSRGVGMLLPVMATFALMIYGIVVAGPWLTVLTARLLARTGRRPSALLAGRRLEDDPASGFRAVSGLVLAVFVASVFSGVTPAVRHDGGGGSGLLVDGTTMAAPLPAGTAATTAVAALAAATSAGAGRGIVIHDPDPVATVSRGPAQQAPPPERIVACADLDVLRVVAACPAGGSARIVLGDGLVVEPSPYPAEAVAAMPAQTLVVETDGTAPTTDRVRTAIQRTVPGAESWLVSETVARANSRLTQLDRMADLALAVTLIVAGCGLAVAVAGGIIERKRPFALLRLAGMHLAELRRVALLEAAAPLLLIAVASAVLGLSVSALIVLIAGDVTWAPPSIGYWVSLAGGLTVAVAVAAATLPLLGRATAPSAVRFE